MNISVEVFNDVIYIFETLAIVLSVSFLTVILQNAYSTRKEIVHRQENYKVEQEQIFRILREIEDMQSNARFIYENAESDHDKAKALYAYDLINNCLSRFRIVGVEKRKDK